MTFTIAAAQSKTFTRAWGDLIDGYRKRELWLHLGWRDIKQKYRRRAGPVLDHHRHRNHRGRDGGCTPSCSTWNDCRASAVRDLGLIIWNMINASILEGADVFIANEGLIKQLPTPLSVHVYRLVWRQMILFAHNIVIYVVIAFIFPKAVVWADLSVIPALLLIMLNCVWVSFCFGILATRYRDIGPLLFSVVQLLFFMTPIIWNDDTLRQQAPAGGPRSSNSTRCCTISTSCGPRCWARTRSWRHWIVVALTVLGWLVAALALRQYRARVPYWV